MKAIQFKKLLIGDEEERAVSPVIGVILMVAITVILAAVIATLVMDFGDSVNQEAQSGASLEFDNNANELTIELTSSGNADEWQVRGNYWDGASTSTAANGNYQTLSGPGDVVTLECDSESNLNSAPAYGIRSGESGSVSVVASIDGQDTWTTIDSEEWNCP
ncbi:type IV pilin [Halovivax cerinus]|uniref:Type IV pilin n=1 Tax=Halovivax cerinus TaxID=1487865 RepID=A0ABD5NTE5_9EURY|nr:type IV pilin N-terminal domain-containing protein [Halovivax cerinus]